MFAFTQSFQKIEALRMDTELNEGLHHLSEGWTLLDLKHTCFDCVEFKRTLLNLAYLFFKAGNHFLKSIKDDSTDYSPEELGKFAISIRQAQSAIDNIAQIQTIRPQDYPKK